MSKKLFSLVLTFMIVISCFAGTVQTQAANINPGSWAAVDGLGRTVVSHADVGDKDNEKFVGIFYWTWHLSQSSGKKAYNVTEIINQYPEARNDWNHEAWKNTSSGTPYFWDEPLFGYYVNSDRYVVRKHAEMLADADVDVVIFDCTNGTFTWREGYTVLFEVFAEARAQGVDTPQVAFMLNFAPNEESKTELKLLYSDIYSKGKYQDLWFMWEGKPLVMAHPECLNLENKKEAEIAEFFTFRKNEPSYFVSDRTIDQNYWGWCSVYPQAKYGVREDGSVEQMTVNVAQNASEHGLVAMNDYRGGVYGRGYAKDDYSYSYTYKNETVTINKDTENAYFYGLNFQQQWDYALEVDPDFIFITGWNEWIAGRHQEWQSTTNAFPDQYNAEFSRDIEPSKGILKDYFYYQLVSNVRKYKGVDAPDLATEDKNVNKTININSSDDQWADVLLSFDHYTGSTIERDSKGWGTNKYESNTMRNDIVTTKVAYDNEYVYFMVETLEELTPSTDPAWMRLLIDTDHTGITPNWEGFEYIINRVSPNGFDASVEKSTGGWNFESVGTAKFSVQGKRLQIAVPREALGMTDTSKAPEFNFKWADNTRADNTTEDSGDILDFYQYGDVAPGGRFMFQFTGAIAKTVIDDTPEEPTSEGCTGCSGGNASAMIQVLFVAACALIIKKKK
ncbi:MAG: hypothetical protein E7385_04735 [Ruminococcaceae bacterium]|nr:hypothetical protein [Oscillospiraceae bacterium]